MPAGAECAPHGSLPVCVLFDVFLQVVCVCEHAYLCATSDDNFFVDCVGN